MADRGVGESLERRVAELGVVEVASRQAVRDLVARLLGVRGEPVVGLALMEGAEVTVLPPRAVRRVIGAGPPIYILRREYFLRQLSSALGRRLGLTVGAARIWWPGLCHGSDPADHPLILHVERERADSFIREFARQFDLSRPAVREEIKTLDGVRGVLAYELEQERQRLERAEERLRDEQIERHRQHTRAQAAEARADAAEAQLALQTLARTEELLHTLIFREWMAWLTDAQRREHPLGRYLLSTVMLAHAAGLTGIPRQRLALACAQVACGHPLGQPNIAPKPLIGAPGGPQRQRDDGAKVWQLALDPRTPRGPRLHYSQHADGTIEFTAITTAKPRRTTRGRSR